MKVLAKCQGRYLASTSLERCLYKIKRVFSFLERFKRLIVLEAEMLQEENCDEVVPPLPHSPYTPLFFPPNQTYY